MAFGLDIKHTPQKKRQELVEKYLDIVGLTKYRSYYPKQLSASMLQRVSIARLLPRSRSCCSWTNPTGSWILNCASSWRTS